MNPNVAQFIDEQARLAPTRAAVLCPHRPDDLGRTRLTFAELRAECDALAWGLTDLGLKPGMRTLLAVKPGLEFVALTFALFKAGAVPVLIDPGMGVRNFLKCAGNADIEAQIATPEADVVLTHCNLAPLLRFSVHTGMPSFLTSRVRSIRIGRVRASGLSRGPFPTRETTRATGAAILFTSGGTGIPKGVCYEHGMFAAQLEIIRKDFGVSAGEVDLPAFPLFALFSAALGATCVIPDMDSSRPARCDPEKIASAMRKNNVTYSFGSPAIWKVVGPWCQKNGVTLPSVTRLFMAGAPVRAEVLQPMLSVLPENADVLIPYGATEALPVCCMSGREVLSDTWALTRQGKGYCVGRPVTGMSVKIIAPDETKFRELAEGEIGEIAVNGPVVTKEYFCMPSETAKAKVFDEAGGFWHRMGDLGYRDAGGRLWFCGRKAHFVRDSAGVDHYSVCREAVFEEFLEAHFKAQARAALVCKISRGTTTAALVVEAQRGSFAWEKRKEITQAWRAGALSERPYVHSGLPARGVGLSERGTVHSGHPAPSNDCVSTLLFYPHPFPVDVRHNAKIDREKLGRWASRWWRR